VRSQLTRLTEIAAEARVALTEAVAARIPLPEPVADVPNIEAQLHELLGTKPPGEPAAPPKVVLVRELLTLPEYADAMDMKFETLRAQVWLAQKAGTALRFPEGDKHNKWFQPLDEILVSYGNWRFVKWAALDKSKYTPSQLAAFEKTLSEPISNVRWMEAERAILAGDATPVR